MTKQIIGIYANILSVVLASYGVTYLLVFNAKKIFLLCVIASFLILISKLLSKINFLKTASWIIFLSCLCVIFEGSLFIYGFQSPLLFWLIIMPQIGNHLGISLKKTLLLMVLGFVIFSIRVIYGEITPELNQNNLLLASCAALFGITVVNLLFKQIYERSLLNKNKEIEHALGELKSAQNQLVEKEKMALIGVLSAGIGHEVGNALNNLGLAAGGVRKQANKILNQEEYKVETIIKGLDLIDNAVRRATDIINNLSNASRSSSKGDTNVLAVVDGACVLLGSKLKKITVDIEKRIDKDLLINADQTSLMQIVMNLLSNAIDVLADKKDGSENKILIQAERKGNDLIITHEDNGPGIKDELKTKIFDPFFTTKGIGKGTGLGLYVCMQLAKENNGEITVEDSKLGGAKFVISLKDAFLQSNTKS